MDKKQKKDNYSLNTQKKSFKNIKITDVYKDLYSSQTAEVINSLKRTKLKKVYQNTVKINEKW